MNLSRVERCIRTGSLLGSIAAARALETSIWFPIRASKSFREISDTVRVHYPSTSPSVARLALVARLTEVVPQRHQKRAIRQRPTQTSVVVADRVGAAQRSELPFPVVAAHMARAVVAKACAAA